jgi:anti-sigma B factor antagonist
VCCRVLWGDRVAVVTLPSEIDVTNADAVGGELISVIDQGAEVMVGDMGTTLFCDSAGLSALVRAFRRATSSGAKMRLVTGGPAVARVLSLTGVDQLIEVYPSVGAALGSPGTANGGS